MIIKLKNKLERYKNKYKECKNQLNLANNMVCEDTLGLRLEDVEPNYNILLDEYKVFNNKIINEYKKNKDIFSKEISDRTFSYLPKMNVLRLYNGKLYSKDAYENLDKRTLSPAESDAVIKEIDKKWADKKFFYDDITDDVSLDFIDSYINRENIVKYFITGIQELLDNYCTEHPTLSKGDIFIAYKGGLALRLYSREMTRYFNLPLEKKINEKYGKYYKLSDNDFEIIIKDGVKGGEPDDVSDTWSVKKEKEEWDKIYNDISIIGHMSLIKLSEIMDSSESGPFFLGIKSRHASWVQHKLKNIVEKFQVKINTERASDPNYTYNDIKKVDGIIASNNYKYTIDNTPSTEYRPYNLDIDQWKKDSKRSHFMLIQSEKNNQLPGKKNGYIIKSSDFLSLLGRGKFDSEFIKELDDLSNNRSNFYSTFNNSIQFGTQKFFLTRIKYNFKTLFEKDDGTKVFLNIPGEMIDLVVRHRNDFKLGLLHADKYYRTYEYTSKTTNPALKFKSYSYEGHVMDLIIMLFVESPENKPWKNPKYEKRVRRLGFMLLISFFNKSQLAAFNVFAVRIKLLTDLINFFSTYTNYNSEAKINTFLNNPANNLVAGNDAMSLLRDFIVRISEIFKKKSDGSMAWSGSDDTDLQSFMAIVIEELSFIKQILSEHSDFVDKDKFFESYPHKDQFSTIGFHKFE